MHSGASEGCYNIQKPKLNHKSNTELLHGGITRFNYLFTDKPNNVQVRLISQATGYAFTVVKCPYSMTPPPPYMIN